MELRQYFALFRKWAWLVILLGALSAGSSYLYSLQIRPIYRADTTVLVGQTTAQNQNPYIDPVQSATNFANAYSLLATQPAVLQATAEAIQWQQPWQNLYFKVTAKASGGQLIQISVTDLDPQQAQTIANEIARQLILKGPISAQQKQTEDQREFVTAQLTQIKSQVETAQKSLTNLTNQAALENDPLKLNDLNARIAILQSKIADAQRNYASLSQILLTGSNLFVTVLAPAQEPRTPISPNIPQNVLFALIAGAVLAGGVAFLLEYLDDTIKDADDVQRVMGISMLGAIMRITGVRQPPDNLVTAKHPRSPIAEAYRVLRTNLRFSGIENPTGALVVTSASPGEGKTTTAANLAVTIAQGGRRVILLDTDLHRPMVGKLFGFSNDVGVSSLFLDDAPTLDSVMQATEIPTLRVITSGPLPPNPAEMLDSQLMKQIMHELRAQSDMVILDSPPTLAVADASILGAQCSGAVLVIDAGRTRSDASRRALQTLKQTGAKVFGVVLNKLSTRRASGYYHYYYYSHKDKPVEKSRAVEVAPPAPRRRNK
ncbi:MAG: polysaccharide biosynthesis tyrosine autokinase [Chloroflexi bacterium]|nr:polysaccharide biosynthesis tyrosine autokinase [Chloroflexota bacterium]